jgi:hypothetical protein
MLTVSGGKSIGATGPGISISESSTGAGKSSRYISAGSVLVEKGAGDEVGWIIPVTMELGELGKAAPGVAGNGLSEVGEAVGTTRSGAASHAVRTVQMRNSNMRGKRSAVFLLSRSSELFSRSFFFTCHAPFHDD